MVGEGVIITGEITLPGAVFLEGTVVGRITAGEVFVGVSGEVKGAIVASKADIRGIAGESVEVHDHITLRETARIKGNLTYRSVEIERGGVIEGQLTCLERSSDGAGPQSEQTVASNPVGFPEGADAPIQGNVTYPDGR